MYRKKNEGIDFLSPKSRVEKRSLINRNTKHEADIPEAICNPRKGTYNKHP